MAEANLDMWTETTNKYLDTSHSLYPDANPTTLHANVLQATEKLMKQEYFVNKIRKLARSKDQKTLLEFESEHLRSLEKEVNLLSNTQMQDAIMQDPIAHLSKTELIQKTTNIWQNTAKTLWQDNILMCNQETLDQATCLLLLDNIMHKYAMMMDAQVYDMEIDHHDSIITKIMELNKNAAKVIKDICQKPLTTPNRGKLDLIKKQGWETAKHNVIQNPNKFSPPNIPLTQYSKIVSDIVDDLRDKEDDSWALRIIKDIKNKGLQSKAMEYRIQTIVWRLNNLISTNPLTTTTITSPQPSPQAPTPPPECLELVDQDMIQADPIPWTDTEDYKQNHQLWINLALEIFEKLALYFPAEDRKHKEELFWEAADICADQDKDLLQLQTVSLLMDSNKKRELEDICKLFIDKEYQSLVNVSARQEVAKKKEDFKDYLTMKDFEYYVQHAREQLTNLAISKQKKSTLKKILQDTESTKWHPKH
ncbi:hypothetical protein AMATHDRAFT_8564 [Amanita thiersii Skay4041]|uniref:Uncharacterized protein n=1 Tax=Amanita thiersii Skay4041 TaxID=703135 RepID=A0A2A9NDR1_9AGAR|nr:hypothetical protein AMATHDRAFT_8564 [Amanita thiersii Skay4041]